MEVHKYKGRKQWQDAQQQVLTKSGICINGYNKAIFTPTGVFINKVQMNGKHQYFGHLSALAMGQQNGLDS